MKGGLVRRVLAWSCASLVSVAVGCGTQTVSGTAPALAVRTAPLSTSLVTPQGTWAVAVMGGRTASENDFWQLFVRPAGASRWSLVTPEGVADNGGLVATSGAGGASLLVGFRPSQGLAFSPLATSSDAGRSWVPGLLDADLADVPDAMAVAPSGRTLALLRDGSIEAAATSGAATAGQWSPLTSLSALAATAPGRGCGLVAVNAVAAAGDEPGDEHGVSASGFGPSGSVWVLLGAGRAETISGPGSAWRTLPALPAGTATLAPGPGPGTFDALAVSGPHLVVWRLAGTAWTQVQVINVPISYGSSS